MSDKFKQKDFYMCNSEMLVFIYHYDKMQPHMIEYRFDVSSVKYILTLCTGC